MGNCSGANNSQTGSLVTFKGTKNTLLVYDPGNKEMKSFPIFYDSATPFMVQLRKYTLFSTNFLIVAGGLVEEDYLFNVVLDLEARGLSPSNPFASNRVYLFDLSSIGSEVITVIDKKNKNIPNLTEPRFDHTVFESSFHGAVFAAFGLDKDLESLYSIEFFSIYEMALLSIRKDQDEIPSSPEEEDPYEAEGRSSHEIIIYRDFDQEAIKKVSFGKKHESNQGYLCDKLVSGSIEKYVKKPHYKKQWDRVVLPLKMAEKFKDTRNPCMGEVEINEKKVIVFLFPGDLFGASFHLLLMEMEIGKSPAFDVIKIEGSSGLVDYFLTSFALVESGNDKLVLFGLGKRENWSLKAFQIEISAKRIDCLSGIEITRIQEEEEKEQNDSKILTNGTRIPLGVFKEDVYLMISNKCVVKFSLKSFKFTIESFKLSKM